MVSYSSFNCSVSLLQLYLLATSIKIKYFRPAFRTKRARLFFNIVFNGLYEREAKRVEGRQSRVSLKGRILRLFTVTLGDLPVTFDPGDLHRDKSIRTLSGVSDKDDVH